MTIATTKRFKERNYDSVVLYHPPGGAKAGRDEIEVTYKDGHLVDVIAHPKGSLADASWEARGGRFVFAKNPSKALQQVLDLGYTVA